MSKSRLVARTWPSGDGTLWSEAAGLDIATDPDTSTPIGLSIVPNFNNPQDGPQEVTKLARYGGAGITRYGRHMVRSGSALLEKSYGIDCLSFITCTIPGNPSDTAAVAKDWGRVTNRFMVSLRRELAGLGMPDYVIGCTEIQEQRFLATGGMPLHLHLVVVGRKTARSHWKLQASRLRELWGRAVCSVPGVSQELEFGASCDIQKVKKSAAAYLGKYLSKGSASVEAIRTQTPELIDLLPSQWWLCSRAMRVAVLQHVAYGSTHAEAIDQMMQSKRRELFFRWVANVPILDAQGGKITSVTCYSLSEAGKVLLGIGGPAPGYFAYPPV